MKRMFFVVVITSVLVAQSGWSAEKNRNVASSGINTTDPNLTDKVCGVHNDTALGESTSGSGSQGLKPSRVQTL